MQELTKARASYKGGATVVSRIVAVNIFKALFKRDRKLPDRKHRSTVGLP